MIYFSGYISIKILYNVNDIHKKNGVGLKRGNIRKRSNDTYTITIELPKNLISNKRVRRYYTVKGKKTHNFF